MAASPWLALRQAREAVTAQRPEEAHRLIEPLLVEGYRRAYKLAREVVKAYVTRARRALDQHNPDSAWRDLLAAESLNTGEKVVTELRQTLSKLSLVQAKAMLEAARPIDAIDLIAKLRDRGVRYPDLEQLEISAQDWILAAELADRGEFLRAAAELDRIAPKLLCPTTGLEQFRAQVEDRHTRFCEAVARLYDAAEAKRWREAVAIAAEVLVVAPDHREAKAIRGKAWVVAAPETTEFVPFLEDGKSNARSVGVTGEVRTDTRLDSARAPSSLSNTIVRPIAVPVSPLLSSAGGVAMPKRFLLWVDGVGGYLVCLSSRVTFGQATAEGPVDVPLFADVSRTHAEVTRDNEGYVIESARPVRVNGSDEKRAVLASGDRVTLGASCQFVFHKPVAVSSSVRLELTSGHRLPVAVEGVILMANELMLGPGPEAHILLPHLSAPVLIYRSKDGLGIRVPETRFTIDDRPCLDRAPLPLPAVVAADSFTFAVEPVAGRL
ncbi:MAG: FHA domain-containing protein [Planctomycetia bacterium]|nr:FHA domain-containing protein [Planctomycetia bacterium]